jgi:DNA-binding NarL/FixJ family response regulator
MDGRSAEEIARDFVVSLPTVRTQIRSILLELGVNSPLSTAATLKAGWRPDDHQGSS